MLWIHAVVYNPKFYRPSVAHNSHVNMHGYSFTETPGQVEMHVCNTTTSSHICVVTIGTVLCWSFVPSIWETHTILPIHTHTYSIIAKSGVDIDCEQTFYTAILLMFMYNTMISTSVPGAQYGQPTRKRMYDQTFLNNSLCKQLVGECANQPHVLHLKGICHTMLTLVRYKAFSEGLPHRSMACQIDLGMPGPHRCRREKMSLGTIH